MSDPPRGPPRSSPRAAPAHPAQGTRGLGIGDLAREFGISTRAIRFYEARGLIRPIRQGQNRTFGPADRRRLTLILRAKNLGFSLEEIGEHLALIDAAPRASEAKDILGLKQRTDRQIAALKAKRGDLALTLKDLRRLSANLGDRLTKARQTRGS